MRKQKKIPENSVENSIKKKWQPIESVVKNILLKNI